MQCHAAVLVCTTNDSNIAIWRLVESSRAVEVAGPRFGAFAHSVQPNHDLLKPYRFIKK